MPVRVMNSTAASASAPIHRAAATGSTSMSTKPAAVSICRVRSGSASENGPGPPEFPPGSPSTEATAPPGTIIHSLANSSCQHANAIRPPGRSNERRWENAPVGSSKNITPKRLTSTSKGASTSTRAASATANRAADRPASALRRDATATSAGDRSTPWTTPSGPTATAASRDRSPLPQPTSITRSPGCGAAAARTASPYGASMRV